MYVATGKGVNVPSIWPYNKDFYLIINCAIGGVLGGNVTPKYWTKINEYNTNSVKRGQSTEGSYKISSRCGCERKSDRGNGWKVIDYHKVYIDGAAVA